MPLLGATGSPRILPSSTTIMEESMDSDGDGCISFAELFLAAEVVADADEAVPPDTVAASVEPDPEPNSRMHVLARMKRQQGSIHFDTGCTCVKL